MNIRWTGMVIYFVMQSNMQRLTSTPNGFAVF
jgi:hypothetical protein